MKRSGAALAAFVVLAACGGDGAGVVAPSGDAGAGDDGAVVAADGASDASSSGDSASADAPAADAPADAGRDYSSNRGAFFGASRCANAHVQLCEDFESGTLDTATWTVSGTAPVIDGIQKARGNKALHITKNANGQSYIREKKTFPAANNTYWARIFVYFAQLPAAPMTYAHWTFAAATGTGVTGEIRLSGQLQGANHFGVGTDSGNDPAGTGDWTNSDKDPNNTPSAVPLAQWLCIEWLHKGDTNETRFFWDATEHASLYTSATKHGGNTNQYLLPQFNSLWIGWQEYQASTETFEMWVDEIAIDKDRIGCVL